MAYLNATVVGNDGVFAAIKEFAGGYGVVSGQTTGSNIGDGTLTNAKGLAGAITETFILTAQAGGTVFGVVGSVSGVLANATVGTPYAIDSVSFDLTQGGIAFDEGDDFTFDTTIGDAKADGVEWEVIHELNLGTDNDEMWLQGKGNSSDDAIFLYFRHFRDSLAGYYNLEMRTCTSYDSGNASDPASQLGATPDFSYVTFWQNNIDIWLVVNSQRIALTAKVNTNYMSLYAGWILPEGYPSELPIPLFIGGNTGVSTRLHTSTDGEHTGYYDGQSNNCYLRAPSGAWIEIDDSASLCRIYPWGLSGAATSSHISGKNLGAGPNGGYIPIEAVLFTVTHASGKNSFGVLDGIYHISAFNNNSENTFTIGSTPYMVFQNGFRTGANNYHAMRLE